MKIQYNPDAAFRAYTKESGDDAAMTVTLTPATGTWTCISHCDVSFDDDPTGPISVEILSGTDSMWKVYINDLEDFLPLSFPEGLTNEVIDEVVTIVVGAAGGGIKSRVNVMVDADTTGS